MTISATANTYTTIATLALAAGTYHIGANVCILGSSGGDTFCTVKLWDGSSVNYASGEVNLAASGTAGGLVTFPLSARVVLAGPITLTLAFANVNSSAGIKALAATPHNAAGNTATTLWAVPAL